MNEQILLRHSHEKAELKKQIFSYDQPFKALTGRTPERIEQETGISKQEMFPENKKILYVGDPWQRMGREIDSENLTIIDYEFGDAASFITDNEGFRLEAENSGKYLLNEINTIKNGNALSAVDSEWLETFSALIVASLNKTQTAGSAADDFSGYIAAAEVWAYAKKFIEDAYQMELKSVEDSEAEPGDPHDASLSVQERGDPNQPQSALAYFRMQAWYKCVYAERGFRDVPDWHNIILPKLYTREEELNKQKLSLQECQEQMAQARKSAIEDIRLKKYTDKANVVEAVFPELPFKNEAFDRFVASWSISAHLFNVMTQKQFHACWQEIERVLKNDGEAYVFPLNHYFDDKTELENSLKEMQENSGGLEYKFYDSNGAETDDIDNAYTLWFQKLKPQKESYFDEINSISRPQDSPEVEYWEKKLQR